MFSQTPPHPEPPPPSFAPAEGDIHDVRGIWVPDYLKYVWWTLIAIAVLVVVSGLVWWLIRYFKSRKPVRTLYQIVMERLRQCRTLIVEGNARAFSGEVSDIVRGYLERRFRVPSTHQTTEEFIRSATQNANGELEPHLPQLNDFLGYCDMAKFARSELNVEQMQLMLDSAARFIESTKPQESTKTDANDEAKPVQAQEVAS
ncbi:MAG: DUF4381 domain-containing protein [Verrucomicrobiales bacterium]|nr:DUF4381 domain-containing protein [Verrucomicrobiales bacterium]